jgi:hypothetical protein
MDPFPGTLLLVMLQRQLALWPWNGRVFLLLQLKLDQLQVEPDLLLVVQDQAPLSPSYASYESIGYGARLVLRVQVGRWVPASGCGFEPQPFGS